MPREGMQLQVDGSHHAWLEKRRPRFTLLLALDDATGDVPCALFRLAEDARGYFSLLERVVLRRGMSLALYTDRHGMFQVLLGRAGRRTPTKFARALGELGITQVFARSPQAKGRVERFAGTLQDRLVTELRHAGASTVAEAQAVLDGFLPRFNARFRVLPAESEPAYRPLDPALDLGAILAFRHRRTVARDNTVKYRWRTLQLLPVPGADQLCPLASRSGRTSCRNALGPSPGRADRLASGPAARGCAADCPRRTRQLSRL